jgi:hypothetical protein
LILRAAKGRQCRKKSLEAGKLFWPSHSSALFGRHKAPPPPEKTGKFQLGEAKRGRAEGEKEEEQEKEEEEKTVQVDAKEKATKTYELRKTKKSAKAAAAAAAAAIIFLSPFFFFSREIKRDDTFLSFPLSEFGRHMSR